MGLLLIDNHSKHVSELLSKFNDVKVVDWDNLDKFNFKSLNDFDGIVLSGGTLPSIWVHREHNNKFVKEVELIKKSNKPILGICFGFQLICFAFGEDVIKMKAHRSGIISIKKDKKDVLLKSIPSEFKAFESHKWAVKEVNYLEKLAHSKDGISIIKHPTKIIYGLQFHPEVFVNGGYGEKILNNFLNLCFKK